MIRRLLAALAIALAPLLASAAAGDCEPKHQANAQAPGSPMVEHWTFEGAVRRWWCPAPAPAGALPGVQYWQVARGDGGLYAYGWEAFKLAAPRVLAAADPWAQYLVESAAITKAPPAGSVDACRLKALHHGACVALRTSALGSPYPPAMSPSQALQAGACGPAPDCAALPPPAAVWRTPASAGSLGTLFKVANGSRSAIAGRTAPKGALCNSQAAPITYSPVPGVVSYFYPLAGGPLDEVTLCQKAPQ